jgi:putative membrane protein
MAKLSEDEHRRIAEAIRKAESRTSGEIFAVVAERSDDYFYVAGFMAACGILVAAVAAALLSHWLWISMPLPTFGLAVLAAFATAILILHFVPALRLHFVPHRVRYRRAHRNAAQQFLAHNVHGTAERTGVLVFVSLAERYAEVVADAHINARVPQEDWNGLVAGLVEHAAKGNLADGFVAAITKAGDLLARHFSRRPDDVNELDDHLVEL